MAVAEDAEQEVAPQNKKPPTEDEKRYIMFIYIHMSVILCDVTLLYIFSLKYFDKSVAGIAHCTFHACQISR